MPHSADGADSILIDELADWLMSRALEDSSAESIFAGCCERLAAADVALSRAHLAFRTLHPMFRSVALVWRRGRPIEIEQHPHGELSEAFRAGPHYHLVTSGIAHLRRRLEGDTPTFDFPVLHDLRAEGATDYVAWAIPFGATDRDFEKSDGLIGSWATERAGGFSEHDLRVLKRIERRLAVACKVTIKNQIARNVLSAYLGPHAGERVWAGTIARGTGENIHAVIWFSDLRESTRLSGEMPLPEFLALLNDFFECIAGPVIEQGGEVLRFIGDAVLAVFPMPEHGNVADLRRCPVHRQTCETALAAAREAMARVEAFNDRRAGEGRPRLGYGIGLHVGDVMYGNIGVPSRVEFSVVGATANHAAKIEALSKSLGVPLVVSSEFAAILPDRWSSLGSHHLPGVAQPQEVCTLSDLRAAPVVGIAAGAATAPGVVAATEATKPAS